MRMKEASARTRFLNQVIGFGCVALVVGAAPLWAVTVTFQQNVSGYTSGQDTFLQQATPGVDNSAALAIGWDGDDPNGTGNDVYALIRFDDIFGGGAGQVPLGEQITEATLYLQIFDVGDTGQVHAINGAWSDTATFTSFCGATCDEGIEYGPLVTTANAGTAGEIAINVTSSVQAWSDGGTNNGWIIRPDPDNGTGGVDARSNEFGTAAQRPRLEVRYGEGIPPVGGLEREPYLQLSTSTSVTICWRSDVASDSRVNYGTSPGSLTLGPVDDAAVVTDHCVAVNSLTPNTQYWYDVGSTSAVQGGATSEHYFWTAPTPGTATPFTFWAVGDGGNGTSTQVNVMNAMVTENGGVSPDMAIYLGDIAYGSGTDSEFTNNYFGQYEPVIRNTVVWPTLGNHEGQSTVSGDPGPSTGPYYEAFVLPDAAQAGGTSSGTEAYYSFDYGNVHFISLNSNEVSRAPGGNMATWLTADLAATTQQWIVAYWHHPPYTKGTHNSDTEGNHIDMRENLLPILEAGGVDLVMGGHSHIYERSYLIDGTYSTPTPNFATLEGNGNIIDDGDGQLAGDGAYLKSPGPNANEGAVYVTAGHGGQGTGGAGNHPVMYFSETANGSCLVDVDANTITLRNVRVDGVVTDTFTLQKGDIPPRVASTSPPKFAVLSGLTSIDVTFTTAVDGVDAGDLTVNGSPATGLVGTDGDITYTFSGFTAPGDGLVSVVLAAGGIEDSTDPLLDFIGDSWDYTVDTTPPSLIDESPARGATIVVLPSISVTFSKPVINVTADDMTVNGSVATSVSGTAGTAGPYVFSGYTPPSEGLVNVVLLQDGIEDDQGQLFAGDNWSYVLEAGLIINEFLASNNTVNSDPGGGFDDWIEIYNPSAATIDMSGMHLTDNLGFPAQYQIPNGVSIPAGGYLLFWCDSSPGQGSTHTNFNLARTGEDVGLFDTAANGFSFIDGFTYPTQTTDVSSGRFPDGAGAIVVMATPTPGASNVVGCAVAADCDSLDDQCNEGDCQGGLCVAVPANEAGGCDDGLDCTDSDVCTAGTCGGTSNCLAGETCNPVTGLCDTTTLAAGHVIISGIQASGTDEWIELFNTTTSAIALDNLELTVRIDSNGDGTATTDWQFPGSLAGQTIPAQGFYLLREGAGPPAGDFTGALDLATGEGSTRAISIELVIDSVHMDYVLYGREDLEPGGTADEPPGDLAFDGSTFPRVEVIRNCGAQGIGGACTPTGSFNEGATLRLNAADLYAGHDVDGRYTDEATLGDGYAAGVWTSDHATTGPNDPRNSSSPTVAPPSGMPCTIDDDCDDSDVCNGDETCVGGFCAAGTALDCDDSNICTDDSCDAGLGCINANNSAACDDGDACTSVDTCSGGTCVGGRARSCDDGVACTDDSCDSGLGCQNLDNCTGGDVCNLGSGVCEAPPSFSPGDVIISGYQAVGSPEWIELFNTTSSPIALDGMNLVALLDLPATPDGDLDVDWDLVVDEAPDLTGLTIPANGFFLLGESGTAPTPDLTVNIDLSTGELGTTERALSLELTVDSNHADYVLYGRHDGADSAAVPPGDLPFDGVSFPRAEVTRTLSGASFAVNDIQRVSAEDLYAGYDIEGYYTDEDTLASGFPNGVWTRDGGPPRNASSGTVAPPGCAVDGDCDDSNPCTDDTCPAGICVFTPNDANACDDGEPCTDDACSAGACIGTANDGNACTDGVACTDDACVGGSCDSTDNCTGGDTCNLGTGICESVGAAPPLPIVQGDDWTYFKGTVEPTTPIGDLAWAQVGFNDLSWLSGPSGYGYGDIAAPNTVLGDMQNGYNSLYVRREFSITDPAVVDSLVLTVDYDDAFVAYINGVEVVRTAGLLAAGDGTPQGVPPTNDQLANFPANTSPGGDQNHESGTPEVFDIGLGTTTPTPPAGVTSGTFVVYGGTLASLLQAGNNVIAIHGHNVTAGSSDFVLIPTMTATFGGGGCAVDGDCDDSNPCTDDTCPAGTCVFTDNDGNACTDSIACTDDACSAGTCVSTDNCTGGETCNLGTGVCELAPTMVMFQNGVDSYSGTQDTFLQEDVPANVNGALDNWEWDGEDGTSGTPNTGLLRFDNIFGAGPGQIPFGSTIDSATLTLVVIDPSVAPEADIHESLSDWDQATESFTSFGGAAGLTAATGPFVALGPLVNGSADIDVTASVQAWSDGTANFGWLFIPNATNGVIVNSSEFATIADRPKLTVTYQAVACTIDDDCDDSDVCNGLETCDAGSCLAGTPLDCDDSNACTDDSCDPGTGCANVNNTDPCDDGDACTENDACSGGSCGAGSAVDCDDSIACTDDSCDSGSGCQNVDNCPVGQLCNLGTGVCDLIPTMSCQLDDLLVAPFGTTTLDTFIQNVDDLRAYQTRITIVPTSGTGTVSVDCPGGVDVDEGRADFVFNDPAITSTVLTTIDCAGREAAAAPLDPESVNVTTARYLSTYTLSVSGDATPGSTFDVFIDPSPGSILRDTNNAPIPFVIAPACTLTIGSPSGELSLNVAPGSEHVLIGETVTVTLDVADLVEPINGVQALMQFDDSLLSLIDITPTDLGLTLPEDGWLELAETVAGGDITYSVGIFGGGETIANGTVATLTFQALANGIANFTFGPDQPPLITKLTAADDAAALIPDKVDSDNMAIGICDDSNACTDDNFDGVACSNTSNVPIGQCCNPADGALSTIDDNDECTDDSCAAGTGAVTHTPNYDVPTECCDPNDGSTVLISDGDACTDDACDAGTGAVTSTPNYDVATECCDPSDGSTAVIDDADECTNDSCNPTTGVVSNTPNYSIATECCDPADGSTTIIDDGTECTDDTCDPGTGIVDNAPNYDVATECCDPVTGTAEVIDDGDACTDDECNALTGIVQHIPNYDTLSECCNPADGTVTVISDGTDCTDDVCDVLTGVVTSSPNYDVATECCNPVGGGLELIDDASVCTDDFCDPLTGIVDNVPNYDVATECCNPTDGGIVLTDDGDECTADVCDTLTGNVTHPLGYDPITECCDPSDGDITTIDDMNECTDDLCNPGTGEVIHLDNTDPCDDLDACTTGDTCIAGACIGTGIDCSDGEFCNGAEVCVGGVCEPGVDDPCPDVCEHCDAGDDACAWCIFDLDFSTIMGTGDFALFSPCFGSCYTSGDACEVSNFDADAGICVGTADYAAFLGCFGDGCGDCPECSGPGGPEPELPRTAIIEVVPTTRRHLYGESHSLPRGINEVTVGEEVYLEIWARLDSLDAAALASVFVDVEFDGPRVDVIDVVPDNKFGTLTSAVVNEKSGTITDLGGCVAPGSTDIGSDGTWVRVTTVRTRVRRAGTTFINLYTTGSLRGTAVVGDFGDLGGAQLDIGRAMIEVRKDDRSSSIGTRKQK